MEQRLRLLTSPLVSVVAAKKQCALPLAEREMWATTAVAA